MGPIFVFLVSVGVGIGMIYFEGAGIAHDFPLRNETFMPAQASITAAKCTTHWLAYTRCEISYRTQQTAGETSKLSYSFLGPAPETSVRLIHPINDQQTIVADTGINHLGNRIAFLVVGLIACAGIGFFSLRLATA